MDFDFEHAIPGACETVAAALLDERFQASLAEATPTLRSRAVVSQRSDPSGKVERRVRCVLGVDLGPARRFVGDADPAWIEHATWYPDRRRWEWRIEPEVARGLLAANGVTVLTPAGDETARRVAGKVSVAVPFYGRRVESVIVDHLQRAYAAEARLLAAWLVD